MSGFQLVGLPFDSGLQRPVRVRKKPVVVEAWQIDSFNMPQVSDWCRGLVIFDRDGNGVFEVRIETLEGPMHAEVGDFVIKGVKGEFYPCKPDIFELTYEPE